MPGSYHHGNLHAALIEAGATLLEQVGVEGLSLRAVARAAGVSRAAPYHHFDGKEGLLTAIAAAGFEDMAEEMAALHGSVLEPRARLRAFGVMYVTLARARPQAIRLMVGRGIGASEPPAVLIAAIDRLLGYVREAVRASLGADPGDEDESMTELISVGAWSLVHGLVQLINDRQITPGAGALPTESALVDGVIDIYIRGLEARAKASANA